MPLQVLKFLGRKNYEALAHFLTDSAIHQEAPQAWRDTRVTPLYKGSGDPLDMNNYRSIAVTPPFTKLFMSIITQRLTHHATVRKLHAPTQAGFRRHHTTIEQALILQTVLQYSTRAKKPLGIVYVDLQKAYDRVCRVKLWDCLVSELDVPPDLVRIICNMYVGSRGTLGRVDGDSVFTFLANMGVKQGDGASPELFILFFDRVYRYIKEYFDSCRASSQTRYLYTLASLQLFMLAFADDVALIAGGVAQL